MASIRELHGLDPTARQPKKKLLRFLIFLFVFLSSASASLFYVYDRPAVYESIASVLIIPPNDGQFETSETGSELASAASDSGLIDVERYQLLAMPLLTRLQQVLHQENSDSARLPENVAELSRIIGIQQFEATPIVRLRAAGPDPKILPIIVNSWLELYRETQSTRQQSTSSDENEKLNAQIEELQSRITSKRLELEAFRSLHDIVSMERDENRLLARLKGLTASLNAAKEEEINAQGHLNALNEALGRGKPIVSLKDERRLANREQRLLALQEQIKDIEQRYTNAFIRLDPDIQAIYRQRKLVEESISELRQEASVATLAAAEQRLASARVAVWGLRNEFEQSKRQTRKFSARFAEHEALVEELAEMEATLRRNLARQLRREVDSSNGITKIEVVESAVLPIEPVWPNYKRDAGIAVGGSLVLGVLIVLLFDFFVRPERAPQGYRDEEIQHRAFARSPPPPAIDAQSLRAREILPAAAPLAVSYAPSNQALSRSDLAQLLSAGDSESRLIIGLLLSGVPLDQIVALRRSDIDISSGVVTLTSGQPHSVAIADALRGDLERRFTGSNEPDDPAWCDQAGAPRSRADLEALIDIAAHDAGLAEPELASAEGIWHSYLVYLVGQGMRLADLEFITGPMAPGLRAGYARYAPAGAALPFEQIETVHPVLQDLQNDSNA